MLADCKNFINKAVSIFITFISNIAWILIDLMLITTFIWITESSIVSFLGKNMTREIVISYLSGIAICLAIASALFSYAKVCEDDERQKITKSGREILYGGVILLISFMLNYYQIFTAEQPFKIIQPLLNYTRLFAIVISIIFAFVSALRLHKGFKLLINCMFY